MSEAKHTETLAEMGLHLITAAYASYPHPMLLGVEDAFGLRNVKDTYFSDPTERHRRLSGDTSKLVRPMIDAMVSDGIFRGRQALSGDTFVTLASPVRAALRVTGDTGRARFEAIQQALEDKTLRNAEVPHGAFTAMARLIGFEP